MTITDPVREQAPSHARSRRPLLIAGGGIVVVAAAAAYATGWTSLMGVSSIDVQGATATSPEQLVAAAGIAKGTPMMRVDLRAATARIADLPTVASVDVRRDWPRGVLIRVSERQAVAIRKAGDSWDLLDANGVPFAVIAQKPKDLPTVMTSPDEAINTAMLRALAGMTPDVRAQVATVSATSQNAIRLTLRKSDATVNWGSAEQSDYKSAVLAVLLGTDSGWYDVSNPDTPTTADAAPQPVAPSPSATAGSVAPTASPSPTTSPTPETSASTDSPTPGPVEAPVGVVPQTG
jgi:cell division protein FtsQ